MDISISEICRVTFSIGKHYVCEVSCDILNMDVCHIILGHPWQFDVGVIYDGRSNSYSLEWKGRPLKLMPYLNDRVESSGTKPAIMQLVSGSALIHAIQETHTLIALIVKEQPTAEQHGEIPIEVKQLLDQFADVALATLPAVLQPLRALQHKIDLISGATLPNAPHYQMSPKDHAILQELVKDLLEK
ncbi:uncharacterized protein LOC110107739 [Dendrobium catenatum]|uniref:uncharacterized protein LOC110107739 n=1 Tax=Dendrobium catenatum TaxID=906689 RepID=UPI0009F6F2BA|nr:uncharacterized protein LOC110107739 [Dendrobium catenatum]